MVYHDPSPEKYKEITSSGNVIVDFWATWCGPCRAQAPIVEQLEAETNVDLVKIDVDGDATLPQQFEVSSIPTLLIYKDGKLVNRIVGLTPLDELKKQFGL